MPLKLRLRQVVKFKVDRYRVSELSAPGGVSTNNFALFGEGEKFPGFNSRNKLMYTILDRL